MPVSRIGKLLVFFGGGTWHDIGDADERSTYATAGFIVLVNAAITWLVSAAALTAVGLTAWVAVPVTLLFALLVGAFGRVLASRMADRRRRVVAGDFVRAAVAVLLGLVVGELAALALFAGPVNAELNAQVDAARASVASSDRAAQLATARTEQARLDAQVATAIERRDRARVVARCEYNPTPECPPEITGDPGTGPEAVDADAALAAAEADLADARAARAEQVAAVGGLESALARDRARAEALARADNGIDARWSAMHSHTTDNAVALVLRLGVDAFFVVLNLLPLLLRLLRGETLQDTRILARRERLRAEEEADTAIALRLAEERVRAAERPEVLALPAADSAHFVDEVPPEEEPAPVVRAELERVERPAPPVPAGPLAALPGPLPRMVHAVTRPLETVTKVTTAPARTAKALFEEIEEFRFSLTRRRTVRVESDEPADSAEPESTRHELSNRPTRGIEVPDTAFSNAGHELNPGERQAIRGPTPRELTQGEPEG